MFFTHHSAPKRHFLIPEVVQTSAMDCGPAALKALLAGFDIPVSYGRLREVCQTNVDGTSIDTLEDIANQLGLEAEQVMVPIDHFLLPDTHLLPAITVVTLANGMTHFVVLWRKHGKLVQLMDPGVGRRWLTQKQLSHKLFVHTQQVATEDWYEWASTEDFCQPLKQRLEALGIMQAGAQRLLQEALDTQRWQALAALDAATRMVTSLTSAKGLRPGEEAAKAVILLSEQSQTVGFEHSPIPASFWSAYPTPEDETQLFFRGIVLVRVTGLTPEALTGEVPLSPELSSLLTDEKINPEQHIWQLLKKDGLLLPSLAFIAALLSALGVTVQILLFKELLEFGQQISLINQHLDAFDIVFTLVVTLIFLDFALYSIVARMGRRLETHLRLAFLQKIPKLGDRYFHSRLTSDMTERAYELKLVRTLPELALQLLTTLFLIIFTTLGIIWLNPNSFLLAILASSLVVGLSLVFQPMLREQDLRFRTHDAALSRFYLDALLGLTPLRTHSAEQSLRTEYENLLSNWVRAGWNLGRTNTFVNTVQWSIYMLLAIWIVFDYVAQAGEASGILVLLFWVMRLPVLGQQLSMFAQQYPSLRNRVLRLLEPLTTSEESKHWYPLPPEEKSENASEGITIDFHAITVQASGHSILTNLNAHVSAGEHIAIVGASGAGKSSLVGLLLGWHYPITGHVKVDGKLLHADTLQNLRKNTAWVDPEVQLWNRSLRQNLYYGEQGKSTTPLDIVLEQADLLDILNNLPNKLETSLGENGGLVSGGEGQRVRLGRAMLRNDVKLVILDEPFRGLDRSKRRLLLTRAREYWPQATLFFISHDIEESQAFERVWVIADGKIVEDNHPHTLMSQTDSHYNQLVAAEKAVRQTLWGSKEWRRLWLDRGRLRGKS